MRVSAKKWVAATSLAAVIAVAYSGTTLAASSFKIQLPGATISSGNINSAPTGATTWTSTQPDGTTTILNDPQTTLITPGTTLTGTAPLDVSMSGDNMEAEMNITLQNSQGTPVNPANYGATVTYTVDKIVDGKPETIINNAKMTNNTEKIKILNSDGYTETLDGNPDFNITVNVSYPSNLSDTTALSRISDNLGNITAQLHQVR